MNDQPEEFDTCPICGRQKSVAFVAHTTTCWNAAIRAYDGEVYSYIHFAAIRKLIKDRDPEFIESARMQLALKVLAND